MSNLYDPKSQKGSALLAVVRAKYPGYHPVLSMVDIAHNTEASLELQFNCHKTVAKYIEPELKSVEVKGELREIKTVTVSLFSEDAEVIEFTDVNETTSNSHKLVNAIVGDY